MNDEAAQNPAFTKAGKGVLCAKCDHLNPPGSTTCEYCHAALFMACQHCGKMVQRTSDRCEFCGHHARHRLQQRSRIWRQLFRGGRRIPLWQAGLLVMAVYCTYRIILIFVQ